MRRQHRMDRPPGELAVADLAPAGRAEPSGLADRERREVVVQQERFLVGALQRVDVLLVLAGPECRYDQRLGLAAREQCRAMGARQHASFAYDRAHGLDVAAVNARAGVEDVPAHDLGFEILEHGGDLKLRMLRVLDVRRQEMAHNALFGGVEPLVPLHLVGDRIGRPQVLLDQAAHLFLQRRVVGHGEFPRLLRRFLGELDDRLDHRLEMPVAEHHGAEHHLLGQLLRLGLDHQHGVLGAGDDQVELAFGHLVDLRIEHVFVADEADAGGADRAHERRSRQRQRRRSGHHAEDVGIILEIVRQHGHDHLGIAAPAFGEQWPDRSIDQAGDQRLLLRRPRLALEVAAGNAAGSVVSFLVVAGQRKEIDPFLGLFGGDHGRDDGGVAVRSEHRSVGLACESAGL